ncbi:hypothetical protein VSX64_19805 [Aurantimonas sp. C2-6-R+9]|uniref:hypothetical protein n=1 Tax=unclassified Aurantimonas TaxID=2638230 RepID=UPI002E191454|nr:hypothetical protein [Aurantimonas sp. C2-6-R+9]
MLNDLSLSSVAEEVARALAFAKSSNQGAMIVTPLIYPGGGRVVVRIAESENGYLVSDFGAARREADLLNGDRIFTRIARQVAMRFDVRFDSDMIFDIEVPRPALTMATMAVANAAKAAVQETAERLSERKADDQRRALWDKLDKVFPKLEVAREVTIRGASADWIFDASLISNGQRAVFDMVVPHNTAVHSAVSKFLDLRDMGISSPQRIAVLSDEKATPHVALLSRTAKIIPLRSGVAAFRSAAIQARAA